jgi:hypothetical protein
MNLIFESPSWILSSLIVVIPIVAICMGIVLFVRSRFSAEDLRKSHDVVGFTFSIIGVLYSVILGFTVVSVQERYNKAKETIHTEAIMVANLYRDAGIFQDKDRNQIRTSLRSYVNYVLKEEWWLPEQKNLQMRTQTILEQVWNSYYSIDLTDEKIRIWYSESISKLNNFIDARLSRQFNAWEHLSAMMWSLLIIGALITISFMFFFGLESLRSQMIMTALLAVFSLDHVFRGPEGIKPTVFEQVLPLFDEWDSNRFSN